MKEYITNTNMLVLDSTLKEELDSESSIGEIDAVWTKLKNNKSPGWDGLTAEFYKTFWGNIRTFLHSCYVESISNGSLLPSQRIGILTLIPKPKSPSELVYIKNYHKKMKLLGYREGFNYVTDLGLLFRKARDLRYTHPHPP